MNYIGQNNFNIGAFATPNYVGQLTMPNSFYPTYLLGELQNGNINDNAEIIPQVNNDITAQQIQTLPLPYYPNAASGSGWVDKLFAGILEQYKKAGVLLFSLLLVGFGLYMLAKSTDTGSAVINIAKKI